jgi:hypothetical protein
MLDRLLDNILPPSAERRARIQLRDLAKITAKTIKELDAEDDPREISYILCRHRAAVTRIIQRDAKPEPRWCQFCNEYKPVRVYRR